MVVFVQVKSRGSRYCGVGHTVCSTLLLRGSTWERDRVTAAWWAAMASIAVRAIIIPTGEAAIHIGHESVLIEIVLLLGWRKDSWIR